MNKACFLPRTQTTRCLINCSFSALSHLREGRRNGFLCVFWSHEKGKCIVLLLQGPSDYGLNKRSFPTFASGTWPLNEFIHVDVNNPADKRVVALSTATCELSPCCGLAGFLGLLPRALGRSAGLGVGPRCGPSCPAAAGGGQTGPFHRPLVLPFSHVYGAPYSQDKVPPSKPEAAKSSRPGDQLTPPCLLGCLWSNHVPLLAQTQGQGRRPHLPMGGAQSFGATFHLLHSSPGPRLFSFSCPQNISARYEG